MASRCLASITLSVNCSVCHAMTQRMAASSEWPVTSEIAERLGVSRHQVVNDRHRRHQDFPQPVARLKRGPIWSWRDVHERWARATGRL
jgi:hypothetical protein